MNGKKQDLSNIRARHMSSVDHSSSMLKHLTRVSEKQELTWRVLEASNKETDVRSRLSNVNCPILKVIGKMDWWPPGR